MKDIDVNIQSSFYWTDSKICIDWINNSGKEWVPWVQHRVNVIRGLANHKDWYWIGNGSNPADIPTREISCKDFKHNHMW